MCIAYVSVHSRVVDKAFSTVLARVRSRSGVGELMIFHRFCRVEALPALFAPMFARFLSVLYPTVIQEVSSGRDELI